LLKSGADPALQNHKGSTPLHFLCMSEDRTTHPASIAEELIAAGANVNGRDKFGITPILLCCSSGR
jgi:ankyrin repeat protein